MALRDEATQVLDVSGQTVIPGLIDAHLHLTSLGRKLDQVNLDHARSFEDVVERTAAFAQTASPHWVLGRGWDQNLWAGDRLSNCTLH